MTQRTVAKTAQCCLFAVVTTQRPCKNWIGLSVNASFHDSLEESSNLQLETAGLQSSNNYKTYFLGKAVFTAFRTSEILTVLYLYQTFSCEVALAFANPVCADS